MLSNFGKTGFLLIVAAVALVTSTNSMARDKDENKDKHSDREPTGMYDENSRLHIKNYHKYGYQNGRDRHSHSYRGRSPSYGRYGYENRHRPPNRQMNRYYPPSRGRY